MGAKPESERSSLITRALCVWVVIRPVSSIASSRAAPEGRTLGRGVRSHTSLPPGSLGGTAGPGESFDLLELAGYESHDRSHIRREAALFNTRISCKGRAALQSRTLSASCGCYP